MLKITIPKTEVFDERTREFTYVKEQTISLEHSLVSISKWESKWHKPYLDKAPKTAEETIDYLRCMTLTQNVDPKVYYCIPESEMHKVVEYIEDPMTATTFFEPKNGGKTGGRRLTNELIYYWMIAFQIPFECQKWHLNRLITLIKVCDAENRPGRKLNPSERAKMNAARRKSLKTHG